MKTKMKGNNKGFSLVELIVVMAIMAILAVTLAPRLMHYVDKAKVGSDQQTVSTIFDAAKLAYAQYPDGFKGTGGVTTTDDWIIGLETLTADSTLYNVSDAGKTWKISSTYKATGNDFVTEMKQILKDFTLKSKDVGTNTTITITVTDNKVKVALDYDGPTVGSGDTATGTMKPFEISE